MDMGFSKPSRYKPENKEIRIKIKDKEKKHSKQRIKNTSNNPEPKTAFQYKQTGGGIEKRKERRVEKIKGLQSERKGTPKIKIKY